MVPRPPSAASGHTIRSWREFEHRDTGECSARACDCGRKVGTGRSYVNRSGELSSFKLGGGALQVKTGQPQAPNGADNVAFEGAEGLPFGLSFAQAAAEIGLAGGWQRAWVMAIR